MDYPAEEHKWLSRFIIMSLFGAVLFCIPGCLSLNKVAEGLLALALPVVIIWLSIRTLLVTGNFSHWDHGISTKDKIISYIPLYFGFLMSIALILLFPFMGLVDGLAAIIAGGMGFRK